MNPNVTPFAHPHRACFHPNREMAAEIVARTKVRTTVTVDSSSGDVVYISDEAEFTPRNIQTAESRSTTVYAVEIRLSNTDHKLKPGMPADAEIVISA